ncbi:hypothetical protein FRC03_006647 [Tulasnella sp. 419]|nr:hypothetical protein FRC02_012240 [Tulasnella sp. 418]KAG8970518.1 hypothetical protein FRC03_006647 [Tulasnella sp. 419]
MTDTGAFLSSLGGSLTPIDLIPSTLFTLSYALLFARQLRRIKFPWVLSFGTLPVVIERIVLFSLRASQSRIDWTSQSVSVSIYQYLSFSIGFILVLSDCLFLLRCLLVNATLEDKQRGSIDLPARRFWYRRSSELAGLLCFGAIIPTSIAAVVYAGGITQSSVAERVRSLLVVGSSIALVLALALWGATRVARHCVPHIDPGATDLLSVIITLLAIVPVYRLVVLNTSSNHDSLSKTLFYGLHVLPEWGAIALLFAPDTNKIFNIGPWGDCYFNDKRGIPVLRKHGKLPMDEHGKELPALRQPVEQKSYTA